MNGKALLLAAGCVLVGCKNHDKPATQTAARPSPATASTAAKPVSPDALATRFASCSAAWNEAKWDQFQGCFANDAQQEMPGSHMPALAGSAAIVAHAKQDKAAFPDGKGNPALVLVDGKQLLAITLMTGKNTGAMTAATGSAEKPTDKSIGMYMAQLVTFDATGKVAHEADYLDTKTLKRQLAGETGHARPVVDKLPAPEKTVIAKDDAQERGELATVKQLEAAFDAHDAKALGAVLADKLTWSEQPRAADLDKKAALADLETRWKKTPDLKVTETSSFAAGDYVAMIGTLNHSHAGKTVDTPMVAVFQIDAGKVASAWLFYDRGDMTR